jgi:hypothetical protein
VILAASVSSTDPGWYADGFSFPTEYKSGFYPSGSPSTQFPYQIAVEGTSIFVAGMSGANNGLSVLFTDTNPDAGTAGMSPTATTEPRVATFYSVTAIPSGGAFAAGPSPSGALAVVKLTATNAVDTSFGDAGLVTVPGFSAITGAGITLDASGRVVLATSSTAQGVTTLARLTTAGALDSTFGQGGTVVIPTLFNPHGKRVYVATGADSAIFVPGLLAPRADGGPSSAVGLARVLPSGQFDQTFGEAGIALTPNTRAPTPPIKVRLALSEGALPCNGRAEVILDSTVGYDGWGFLP